MDSGAQRIKIVDIFINHHSDIVAIHSTVRGVSFVMTRQSAKLWGVFFSFFWGGGGGVLPEKFGGGVRPASQNPYPLYDQNL